MDNMPNIRRCESASLKYHYPAKYRQCFVIALVFFFAITAMLYAQPFSILISGSIGTSATGNTNGFGFGGGIEYRVALSSLAFRATGEYYGSEFDNGAGVTSMYVYSLSSVGIDVIYYFPMNKIRPYAGLGFGFSRAEISMNPGVAVAPLPPGGVWRTPQDPETSPRYSAFAGASFFNRNKVSLYSELRYFSSIINYTVKQSPAPYVFTKGNSAIRHLQFILGANIRI